MQYNNLQNRKNEKSIETKLMNKKLINVNNALYDTSILYSNTK